MPIKKGKNIDTPPEFSIEEATIMTWVEFTTPDQKWIVDTMISEVNRKKSYEESIKDEPKWEEKFANEYMLSSEWIPMENNDWEIINLRETYDKKTSLRYEVEGEWEAVVWSSERIEMILTPVQELFCQTYCTNDFTRFNAVMSYAEAYWYDLDSASRIQVKDKKTGEILRESEYRRKYRICGVGGNRLLKNAKIQDRITVLMNELKKDEIVDRRMMEHILSKDNQSSRDMIKEYNKLMQRITDKTKDESESDKAKADLFKALEWQVKTMSKEELSWTIQDLLTPSR